jgi:flavin-dependent dehydrogenase
MDQEYDVIVVGARIGGAITAALLGDAGYRVLLLDRATFPSNTVSTHFFRGEYMVSVLHRLGVLDEVLSFGSPRLLQEYFYEDGQRNYQINPPQSPGEMGYSLSVRRTILDHILVQRACRSGNVFLSEKTSVQDLVWENQRVTGVRLKTSEAERAVRAKIVIGADGYDSTVARLVQPTVEDAVPGFRAAYLQYFEGYSSPTHAAHDGPEFSVIGDEIAYIFPSDNDIACMALSINLDSFGDFKGQHKTKFRERLSHHKGIAERIHAAKPIGDVFGHAPRENLLRNPVGEGWALVGDAGQYQDPWSGVGMDSASMAGTFLAEAIIEWLSGKCDETEALGHYHERRNAVCGPFFNMTVEQGRKVV